MTRQTSEGALGEATSALVGEFDITDLLARLLRGCAEVLDADAVGLLVTLPTGELELLAASSHRVEDLELYQVQQDAGPCVESVRLGRAIFATGGDDIERR